MQDLNQVLSTIGASETDYPFRPIRCREKDLETRPAVNGFVYFTTDTKKIYCGFQNQYLLMGGTSGVYYGQRIFSEDETDTEETLFVFTTSEIEGSETPNVDDLILNTPDGGFYRVRNVYNDEITAERLAIAGGGGGGPVGPGGNTTRPAITDTERGDRYFSTASPETMKLQFYCTSQSAENNYIDEIHYTIGTETFVMKGPYQFTEIISLDLSKHMNKFSTSRQNSVSIVVYDAYGNTSQKKLFTFYLIELTLETDFSSIYKVEAGPDASFSYFFTPKGGSSLQTKYVELTMAAIDSPNAVLWSTQKTVTNVNTNYPVTIKMSDINNIAHGVYLLKACFYGVIPTTGNTLPSNEISSQIIYYDEAVGTPLIASSVKDTTIAQYSKYTMEYMIADISTAVESYADIYAGDKYSTEKVKLNDINQWSYTFLDTGVFDIAIKYGGGDPQKLGSIVVETYAGNVPVIDSGNAELYLTATGRTNNQADRDVWQWSNSALSGNTYAAEFENFLWGTENGWMTNEKGDTALKLSNGAKLRIPNYHPFATEATLNGLTIELDFMFSGVLDYSKPLIQCLSSYTNGDGNQVVQTGFHITGQKATLNSSINKATTAILNGEEEEGGKINETDMALQAFTQYFNEDTRIHLTYVIQRVPDWSNIKGEPFYFVYTYLNGVISGIMKLKVDTTNRTSESFKDAVGYPSTIEIDSTFGDIYIYNIRVYRNELDMRTIINNYIADISDIDEKIALFQDNNIFDDSGYISLNAIQDISYTLGVPYVLFKGGCPMYEDEELDDYCIKFSPDYRLPLTKKDNRLVSMKMYKPDEQTGEMKLDMDVPLELKPVGSDGSEVYTDFNQLTEGVVYQPTRGVRIYGQGTSSMVYPVKNLRVRPVAKKDRPTVYDGSCPVKIVCFKADFMDSSSSHNTNTGNLVYDLYNGLGLRTPPQTFKNQNKGDNVIAHDIVTAIKGYPIICFFATGDEDAPYTYIGRYNFNLDKATPEPFGFVPQFVYTGTTVEDDNGVTRREVKVSGYKTETVKGKTVFPIDAEGKEIKRDIIQCWEILNNDNNSPTKFLTPSEFNGDFNAALTTDNNWVNYYEDRYPDALKGAAEDNELTDENREDLEKGIFRLARWINSTSTVEAPNTDLAVPVFYQTLDSVYDSSKKYYDSQGNEVVITATDNATITAGGTGAIGITALKVNVSNFAAQVGQGNYNDYTFTYLDNKWYLNNNEVSNIAAYGITFNGTPVEGNSITVRYYQQTNWTNALYEKHTVDNATYRLAKFQAEFTDYFDMDFSLFYYTLTLALLMMDSRAKNMMLASWDQTKWYPIFYDMDTMLGVNNTGFNKFSFDTEDDPADKVFNGFDSVLWNNFKECFPDEIAAFYVRMRQSDFSLSKLLETYNEKGADAWNEALSSADASYKYIRPFKEGYYDGSGKDLIEIKPGQISYLYAAQGKRSNHRSWWLSNRLNYLDSKYWPMTYGDQKPTQGNSFSFRAYALPEQKSTTAAQNCVAAVPAKHQFDLTAINNAYQSLMIGNIVYGPSYAVAGQTVTLGPADVKHEVESYILNPTLIADLGDLSNKYIGSFFFPGATTRLTRLKLGRSQYANKTEKDIQENANYSVYYNSLLSALNIGESCPYLNEINIARCTGLTSVDLTKCTRLQTLYADGCSKLTDISFPANSILEEVYLPASLSSLTLTNQPYLTTLHLDGHGSIQSIFLDNISGVDTYELVKSIFANNVTKTFYLINVDWNITSNSLDNGELKSIDILDTLLSSKAAPRDGYEKAQCLSGTLTIDMTCSANEFALYEKYHSAFPNITIAYNKEKVTLDEAVNVKFMTDSAENNPGLHYEVYASGDASGDAAIALGVLTSAAGPNGVAMRNPVKLSSVQKNYVFSGYWVDQNGVKYYDATVDSPEDGSVSLATKVPTINMVFYPVYIETDRYYEVRFYDYDGSIIQQNGQDSYAVKYGSKYDGPMKNFNYRDSSALDLDKRWAFQGWTTTNYGSTTAMNPTYVDVTSLTVVNHVNLYAYYRQENVYEVPTSLEYFDFVSYSNNTVYGIKVKEAYKTVLAGKITLPSVKDGKPVVAIENDGFRGVTNITHVFFLKSNTTQYRTVGSYAFADSTKEGTQLQGVYLPDTITTINEYAFMNCTNLQDITLNDNITTIGNGAFQSQVSDEMKIIINELPKNLTSLGIGAFARAGSHVIITKIPDELLALQTSTFDSCSNVKISQFGSINGVGGKLQKISQYALNNAGNATSGTPLNIISIGENVTIIGDHAFNRYGSATLSEVIFYGGQNSRVNENNTPTSAGAMGFSVGVTITDK